MNQVPLQLRGALAKASDNTVKGFLSVNGIDFEEDTAAPESFDLKSFLVRGTLLYNHRLWLDEQGNPIPVGKVLTASVVKLVEHPDPSQSLNGTVWAIKDVKSGEIIDTFPKDRVPTLGVGDRGVFLTCTVEVEEVWRRILRGMLNGFSWQGTANRVKARIGKTVTSFLNNISMFEASVVFTPQQPESILVPVMKAAVNKVALDIDDDYVIYCLVFSPSSFTLASASAWLKRRGFQFEENALSSEDGELVFPQIASHFVVRDSERTLKIDDGVQAIVGLVDDTRAEKDEKNEILELTERVLGCSLIGKVGDSTMSKKDQLKQVLAKGQEAVVPAKVDAVPAPEVTAEPVVVPVVQSVTVEPVVETAVAPVQSVETPVVETTVTVPPPPVVAAVAVPDITPAVEPPVATSASALGVAMEAALAESPVVNRIAAALSQNVMTVIGEKFTEILGGLNATMEQLLTATKQNAEILMAQADAVTKLLTPASPEVAVAKAAVAEVAPDAGIVALKTQIEELTATVETLRKSAVTEVVPKERKLSKETRSSADVLPKGFLGLND